MSQRAFILVTKARYAPYRRVLVQSYLRYRRDFRSKTICRAVYRIVLAGCRSGVKIYLTPNAQLKPERASCTP